MARPATCKQLADAMGISASSVTHHMKKLEKLGLVELDHTELIRGITAKYWRFISHVGKRPRRRARRPAGGKGIPD